MTRYVGNTSEPTWASVIIILIFGAIQWRRKLPFLMRFCTGTLRIKVAAWRNIVTKDAWCKSQYLIWTYIHNISYCKIFTFFTKTRLAQKNRCKNEISWDQARSQCHFKTILLKGKTIEYFLHAVPTLGKEETDNKKLTSTAENIKASTTITNKLKTISSNHYQKQLLL